MKKLNKAKIKKFLKEKWYIAGGSILLFVGAIVAVFVGLHMTGWSLIEWLKTPYATTFFVLLIIGGLFGFVLFVTIKRFKLGDDEYDESNK